MTPLRQRLLEDLQLRGLSDAPRCPRCGSPLALLHTLKPKRRFPP